MSRLLLGCWFSFLLILFCLLQLVFFLWLLLQFCDAMYLGLRRVIRRVLASVDTQLLLQVCCGHGHPLATRCGAHRRSSLARLRGACPRRGLGALGPFGSLRCVSHVAGSLPPLVGRRGNHRQQWTWFVCVCACVCAWVCVCVSAFTRSTITVKYCSAENILIDVYRFARWTTGKLLIDASLENTAFATNALACNVTQVSLESRLAVRTVAFDPSVTGFTCLGTHAIYFSNVREWFACQNKRVRALYAYLGNIYAHSPCGMWHDLIALFSPYSGQQPSLRRDSLQPLVHVSVHQRDSVHFVCVGDGFAHHGDCRSPQQPVPLWVIIRTELVL
jgi:hypothetical protein